MMGGSSPGEVTSDGIPNRVTPLLPISFLAINQFAKNIHISRLELGSDVHGKVAKNWKKRISALEKFEKPTILVLYLRQTLNVL